LRTLSAANAVILLFGAWNAGECRCSRSIISPSITMTSQKMGADSVAALVQMATKLGLSSNG
jgi:hypothetical protein